ncbi:MAG: PEP-CTERM sorting domain-containing protein [Sphingopyxis sp.]|uniref:PEPxxWA-CTERM sorting domain-containing protein n=1 Tax=Sphingopyxis sp. TaxID=1908224 RepID=UPI001A5A27EF|nr:PEPxxWA-CTERM sorting domain-containing protein [Sphingopyxis sp.]MBL9068975.1 PEP-CTERM sorting domain-containing protein [Sphingopyxis sp.]
MKFALTAFAAAALATMTALPAQAATIVNLNGVANASLTGTNGVKVTLDAGTYNLSFLNSPNLAFTRFSSVAGCDGAGKNCVQGWENSARYIIDGTTYLFGDGAGSGGLGPLGVGDGYYSSAALSFANSGIYQGSFKLDTASEVTFFIYDDNLSDNSGGVSLSVAAVPEPAAWMMMIVGIGAIGGLMRRKRTTASVRYA